MRRHVLLALRRSLCTAAVPPPLLPRLFNSRIPPTQKQRRVAATVREALAYTFSSGIIKDRWLDDGKAVHVLDVQAAKGCVLARVLWEPMSERHDANQVKTALERKSGILRAHVNSYLNQKTAIKLEFVQHTRRREEVLAAQQDLFAAVRADLQRAKPGLDDAEDQKEPS